MRIMTQKAVVPCDHQVGIATMKASQSFVTIDGTPMLRGADPVGCPIGGCPNIGPTIKPCLVTLPMTKGHSGFVTIGGQPVCLETTTGLTDGTPPGMVKYKVRSPAQTFVNVSI
jgi:hypothetical protein